MPKDSKYHRQAGNLFDALVFEKIEIQRIYGLRSPFTSATKIVSERIALFRIPRKKKQQQISEKSFSLTPTGKKRS